MSAFHVDARIDLKLHFDLAVRLGEIILNSHTEDAQIRALGHNLVNLDDDMMTNKNQWSYNDSKWSDNDSRSKDLVTESEYRQPISSFNSMKSSFVSAGLHGKASKVSVPKVRPNKIRWGQ